MQKLYLVWYEPKDKILNIIGELLFKNGLYKFKYLNYDNNDLQLFSKNGLYYGFENINLIYESNSLFPTISNRLPSKKRNDYDKIMDELGIDKADNDFTILSKTEGKLSSDNFLFVTEKRLSELKKSVVE